LEDYYTGVTLKSVHQRQISLAVLLKIEDRNKLMMFSIIEIKEKIDSVTVNPSNFIQTRLCLRYGHSHGNRSADHGVIAHTY
jgi:hypothetical protein